MNTIIELVRKKSNISLLGKGLIITFISFIAALGTLPYGYHFGNGIPIGNNLFKMVLAYLFASAAMFANFALSAYSLSAINKHKNMIVNPVWLMLMCLIVALPVGFICFKGYSNLSLLLDLSMSIAVTLANAGINYTAINNFILNFKDSWLISKKVGPTVITMRAVGFIIGIIASSAYYVVATDGLIKLFLEGKQQTSFLIFMCYFGAFIIWIPSAMLFGNSTQIVFEKMASFNLPSIKNKKSGWDYVILVLAILSGAAFAEIMLEFFSVQQAIPQVFKTDLFQKILLYALVPLAYVASSAVNYLAFINLIKQWRKL